MNTTQEAITRDHMTTTWNVSPSRSWDERTTIRYAAETYAHLLPLREIVSLERFANAIEQAYTPTQPRIAALVSTLRHPIKETCAHLRQSSSAGGTICLDCRKIWVEYD